MSLKLFLMSDFFLLQIIEGKLKKNKKKTICSPIFTEFSIYVWYGKEIKTEQTIT